MSALSLTLKSAILAAVAAVALSTPASARCAVRNCDDAAYPVSMLQGMSCGSLYGMRNSIYHRAGYCFRTSKAKQLYGNAGCQFTNINDVPLFGLSVINVQRIRAVERQKGCSV